jgi:hypothetical protein
VTEVSFKVAFRTCKRSKVPTPPRPNPTGPTSMARRIALAHYVHAAIERGDLRDLAEAAQRLGVSTARITQICDLALLAPDIQAAVLTGQVEPRDRHLQAVGRHSLWQDQRRAFLSLFPAHGGLLTDDRAE